MSDKDIPPLDLGGEIDTLWPDITAAVENVLRSQQFIMGPAVVDFEREVSAYLGVKHAIGVNSGTDALVIALRALDIGPGDEVITTPFSFFATAESISMVGARPVFVDVDRSSFNIDPARIESAITERTRAIMPVHLFGRPADMEPIRWLAEKYGLYVVEDCAQSFGARYQGDMTGSLGTVGAYSFFPTKNLGAYGDAGLVVTGDDRIADLSRMLRAHGARKKYHNEILGYNSRLDSIQAAILRVKLPHIDKWNDERRTAALRYNDLLSDVPGIVIPEVSAGHVFHQYTVCISDDRDGFRSRLRTVGINTMIYYPIPQDLLPIYKGQYPENPVSNELAQQVLSLPLWPGIGPDIQERVARACRN